MLSAFTNCFKIPELRQRIIFSLWMVVIVRIGAAIPCPGVNAVVLGEFFQNVINQQAQGSVIGLFNIFSGGALENCAVFSLSIMPYISASIFMQLLSAIVPQFSRMAREEGGRQKITQYTRYATLGLCVFQGYLLASGLERPESIPLLQGIGHVQEKLGMLLVPEPGLWFRIMTVLTLTTGTMVLMWIGEQITDKGIGNGVSLVITVGIVAKLPAALIAGVQKLFGAGGTQPIAGGPAWLVLLLLFLFGVVAATIAITQAQRKVAINYAKQVRGMKMTAGGTSYLPLKVNYAGVMPIIFAQAIFLFPSFLLSLFPASATVNGIVHEINQGFTHYLFYAGLILFFSYFWVATQFNPVQIADDLKKNGGFIPGVRPGEATSRYLDFAMTRLTLAGAVFLTIIAILPNMINLGLQIPYVTASFFGGTSLLIMVGVMLDTMRQMETHLLQRHYDGFLKKGKLRGRSAAPTAAASGSGLDDQSMMWIYVGFAVLIIAGVSVAYFFKV